MKVCPKCFKEHNKSGIYCSRSCANSRIFSEESRRKKSIALQGLPGRGQTQESREKISSALMGNSNKPLVIRVVRLCLNCGEKFTIRETESKKFCSNSCWKKCSGGLREGSVKNYVHGVHEGYRYDSSWELIWIKWALSKSMKFERNKKGFEYFFREERHLYYPDFYLLDEDRYVEVKGIQDDLWEAKKKYFPHRLEVLGYSEIQTLIV
jgi:hypothetical protein